MERQAVKRAKEAFQSGRTRPLEFRLQQLQSLQRMITEKEAEIAAALKQDINRSQYDTPLLELIGIDNEIKLALEKLAEWAARRPAEKTLLTLSDEVFVQPEPLGVVLIIGAWNYPWAVTLLPLVGAIAAGNAVVLKPSEVSCHCAAVMEELLPLYLDQDLYPVVTGGAPETQELLRLRFDHIFYTGSSAVGRVVMEAASRHLTPVTLELGGKSPAYIDKNCDVTVACRRITWGKFVNCGQTCVAPDYVLCDASVQDRVLEELKSSVKEFFTDDPKTFEDYGRIINQQHFDRVLALLDGGSVVVGGDADRSQRYIAPTVLSGVSRDSRLMQEEIFGPLLPVVTVNGVDEAIGFINQREKPLVIYVFSHDSELIRRVKDETSSGSLLANDCLIHFSVPALPFGGVGSSGMGCYRGRHTFDRLSHLRGCLLKRLNLEAANELRYPPLTARKLSWSRFLLLLPLKRRKLRRAALLAAVLGLMAFVLQRFLRRR